MFSSRSFIVSGLIFKFSIHLQLVFVSGIREESSLILLHMVIYPVCAIPFIKKTVFSTFGILGSLVIYII